MVLLVFENYSKIIPVIEDTYVSSVTTMQPQRSTRYLTIYNYLFRFRRKTVLGNLPLSVRFERSIIESIEIDSFVFVSKRHAIG